MKQKPASVLVNPPKSGRPSTQLKVAVSTHTFLPAVGGAELGIHELYRRIARTHSVTVLTPVHRGEQGTACPVGDFDGGSRYRVVTFGSRAPHGALAMLDRSVQRTGVPQAVALMRLARASGVDVVNCHFVKRNFLVVVAARHLLRVPVVLSLVGRPDVLADLRGVARWRALAVMWSADLLIEISQHCLAGSRLQENARVIPYGVDTEAFRPGRERLETRARLGYDSSHFVILTVQRLARLKRVDIVIQAFRQVLRENPQARLLVVGTGSVEGELRQLSASLELGHAVHFAGYVEAADLPGVFGAADLFASHSESETFGVVFAEAMAAGLPIVAADTSSIRYVLNGESAEIVPPFDVEAFADAIVRLAGSPSRRREMSLAGRMRAEADFDWDASAEAYREALEELAGSAGAHPTNDRLRA